MAEPHPATAVPTELRVVTTSEQIAVAGERLCMAPAALAAAVVEPGGRLLTDDAGSAVLLRREWADDGDVGMRRERGREMLEAGREVAVVIGKEDAHRERARL